MAAKINPVVPEVAAPLEAAVSGDTLFGGPGRRYPDPQAAVTMPPASENTPTESEDKAADEKSAPEETK